MRPLIVVHSVILFFTQSSTISVIMRRAASSRSVDSRMYTKPREMISGPEDELARLGGKRHHHDEQTILRTAAFCRAAPPAPRRPRPSPSIMTLPEGTVSVNCENLCPTSMTLPDLRDEDVVVLDAHALSQRRVAVQVPVFPVDGDEVLGTRQREHQLQLLLAGVARNVHVPRRPR